jgi:hypothetical protein
VFLTCETSQPKHHEEDERLGVGSKFLVLVSQKDANKTWDGSSHRFMINIKFK